MDTSETFIKMSDCPEIQEGHKWEDGDWGYWPKNGDINIITEGDYYTVEQAGEGYLWLPDQDRLQQILLQDNGSDLSKLIERFYQWNYDVGYMWLSDTPSVTMERLWLSFLMHEKYNKIWNGVKWHQQ